MTNRVVHLAAGGTGGHVFPALAVAEVMKSRGFESCLLTDARGAALLTGMDKIPVQFHVIRATSPFQPGVGRRISAVLDLTIGSINSLFCTIVKRPEVVIGFGGYPSFPPLLAARILGVPTMVHEQNAFLGRANRVIAAQTKCIALSWPQTKNVPKNCVQHITGMPVRKAFFVKRSKEPNSKKLVLTILGGSQGASIFGTLIPNAIAMIEPSLRSKIKIYQQARPEQIEKIKKFYRLLEIEAAVRPFFKNMPALFHKSNLVICRSGASSIAELAASGRASLMLPLPSALDDHQKENAIQMEKAGGGYCLDEKTLSPAFLATRIIQLFESPKKLSEMARNAKALSGPNAAKNIADVAEDLIKTPRISRLGTVA